MRLTFARVVVEDSGPAEAELNRFLATHRVLAIERHLVADGSRTAWAVCVTYDEAGGGEVRSQPAGVAAAAGAPKGRVDYRDVLSPPEFEVFVRLRALRKQLADRDGVPVYAVFTNEQIAAMVRGGVTSLAEPARIEGVGPARVDKYGGPFLEALQPARDASGQPEAG
jgi:superfamily II DNA helicase RecQ